MRVLVTGGAGFIGRSLVKELLANNFTVNVIDTVSSSDKNAQSLIQLGAHYYKLISGIRPQLNKQVVAAHS